MTTGKGCNRSYMASGIFFARLAPTDSRIPTTISVARHDLHRYNADMDFRKSFLKPFKKLKGKLPGGSRQRDGRSGSEDGRNGRDVSVKGGGASQRNPYLHSVEGAVEGGPNREGTNVDGGEVVLVDVNPPTSAPLVSQVREPDSM